MNNAGMLAQLISQAADEGADLVTLRAIIEEASELGAQRVLSHMGLDDGQAWISPSCDRRRGTPCRCRQASPWLF